MPPELSDDQVVAICRILIDHEVEFVIIGGMAARLHDTGHTMIDIDICPSLEAPLGLGRSDAKQASRICGF